MQFALSIRDIGELVEFVCFNDLESMKLHLEYGVRKGHSGPNWINSFMKRNNLFLRETTNKFSVACYNAMQNPFVIYHFCDILVKALTQLGVKNRPDHVWNFDKPGLNLRILRSYPKGDEI